MADYYTEFSFVIADVTQEEAEWMQAAFASGIHKEDDLDDMPYEDCFALEIQQDPEMRAWIHDGNAQPTLDALIGFLKQFLSIFRVDKEIFFEWGYSCSKHHTDGFGGGAALISATKHASASTQDLMVNLRRELEKAE